MSKKQPNLSALGEKIAHKSMQTGGYEKFEKADEVLKTNKPGLREKVIRRSYALTRQDVNHIELIKDKFLNHRVVINDSHVVRLALHLAASFSEANLLEASKQIPKLPVGRPKERESED